ncbi:MAG: HlyD family efflux transporter periplasmic adaptor subunit [Planctomycetes bacterium]|nr:HlyD family efflux transporter periplasmic adaptor subunit [Planctomycetota bacterium]
MTHEVRRIVGFGVWFSALVVCVILWTRRQGPAAFPCVIEDTRQRVAFAANGYVGQVLVDVHGVVEAGTPLAMLEQSGLELELRAAQRELDRLRAEFEREESRVREAAASMPSEHAQDLRRLERDVESAQLDLLKGLADQEEDRILLNGLELQLARSSSLAKENLGAQARLDDDRTRRDATRRRIEEREATLQAMRQHVESAKSRLDTARSTGVKVDEQILLRPFHFAILVHEARITDIERRCAQLTLRAPRRARVARIMARAGEFVSAGSPIVELVDVDTLHAVGYVSPVRAGEFAPGRRVTLIARADARAPSRAQRGTAVVVTSGVAVEVLPERLWLEAGQPRYGVPIRFELEGSTGWIPGQACDIHTR